jgi:hypothetical protein
MQTEIKEVMEYQRIQKMKSPARHHSQNQSAAQHSFVWGDDSSAAKAMDAFSHDRTVLWDEVERFGGVCE